MLEKGKLCKDLSGSEVPKFRDKFIFLGNKYVK